MDIPEIKVIIKTIIADPFSADNLTQPQLESVITYANEKFFNKLHEHCHRN